MMKAVNDLGVVEETCTNLVSAYTVTSTGSVSETAQSAKALMERVAKTRAMFKDWQASIGQTGRVLLNICVLDFSMPSRSRIEFKAKQESITAYHGCCLDK